MGREERDGGTEGGRGGRNDRGRGEGDRGKVGERVRGKGREREGNSTTLHVRAAGAGRRGYSRATVMWREETPGKASSHT